VFSDIFNHVHHAIEHYGYLAVALGILLEHFGLPTPGETLLISGSVAASRGLLNIYLLLFLAWLAGVVGNSIGYVIGYNGGHRLLLRYGGRIGITEARLKQVEGFFARFGDFVIVFARFVPVLRQFSGIVAGTLEMPWWRFAALNALGCALWVGAWGMLAYTLGKRFFLISRMIQQYQVYVYVVGGILIVLGLAYFYWRSRRNRRKNAEPPAPQNT
jgi:membrane protein DedA with SNARE-associated domain